MAFVTHCTSVLQYTFKIFKATLYTIRPSATIGACLLALAAFNPQIGDISLVIPLLTAAFFGGSFCFLVNDIYDKEKDLLNNKKRPIATGVIPMKTAIGISTAFMLLFLISTWFLGIYTFALSFGFLAMAITYSFINAKTGLFANVVVALIVSGTQWGVAVIKPDHYLFATAFFLFFFTIPREVLLDWLDLSGDEKSGKQSFPMNHSSAKVNQLIVASLVLGSASIHFIAEQTTNTLSLTFYILALITSWVSFVPFFRSANDQGALLSVRLSHVTFAFLILALFSR
ncbi:UbiA family prenyltransferase [Ekhidna sp.]